MDSLQVKQCPLENDVILTEIFKALLDVSTLEDVGDCRLVCRQWNENVLRLLKHCITQQIEFYDNDTVMLFLEDMTESTEVPYSSFSFNNVDLKEPPIIHNFFKNVVVKHLQIKCTKNEINTSSLLGILQYCCNNLKSLKLKFSCEQEENFSLYLDKVKITPLALENLTELKLNLTNYKMNMKTLRHVFNLTPKLQSLSYKNGSNSVSPMLEALAVSPHMNNLKTLKIRSCHQTDLLYALQRLVHLKLHTFEVKTHLSTDILINGEVLAEFLRSQKDSLTSLRILRFTFQDIVFPVLLSLKSLHVTLTSLTKYESTDGAFIRKLGEIAPNLTRLVICNPSPQVIPIVTAVWSHLETMEIPGDIEFESDEEFELWKIYMLQPNSNSLFRRPMSSYFWIPIVWRGNLNTT